MTKNKVPSQNVTKKFSKWPYFTICTAPSTVKSKNLRSGTANPKNKSKNVALEKGSFSVASNSNSRTRSNPKRGKKSGSVTVIINQ